MPRDQQPFRSSNDDEEEEESAGARAWRTKDFADAELVLAIRDGEKTVVSVHRLVLCAASSYFAAMFLRWDHDGNDPLASKSCVVEETEVRDAEDVEAALKVLEMMYTRRMPKEIDRQESQRKRRDGAYRWEVNALSSTRQKIASPVFYAAGHPWKLVVYPYGETFTDREYISVYAVKRARSAALSARSRLGTTTSRSCDRPCARFTFKVPSDRARDLEARVVTENLYDGSRPTIGFKRFVRRADVNSEAYQISSRRGSIAIEVEVETAATREDFETRPSTEALRKVARMIRWADAWLDQYAVNICATWIVENADFEVLDTVRVLTEEIPEPCLCSDALRPATDRCRHALSQTFNRVPKLVRTLSTSSAPFLSLNTVAVKLWAESDRLFVDSENDVVAALALWWEANQDAQFDYEAVGDLVSSIRLDQTTSSYRQEVLPRIELFRRGTPFALEKAREMALISLAAHDIRMDDAKGFVVRATRSSGRLGYRAPERESRCNTTYVESYSTGATATSNAIQAERNRRRISRYLCYSNRDVIPKMTICLVETGPGPRVSVEARRAYFNGFVMRSWLDEGNGRVYAKLDTYCEEDDDEEEEQQEQGQEGRSRSVSIDVHEDAVNMETVTNNRRDAPLWRRYMRRHVRGAKAMVGFLVQEETSSTKPWVLGEGMALLDTEASTLLYESERLLFRRQRRQDHDDASTGEGQRPLDADDNGADDTMPETDTSVNTPPPPTWCLRVAVIGVY